MEHLLILLVGGLIVLVRKLFFEGGLAKMLGKLDADLNQPDPNFQRKNPPPMVRQMPASRNPSLNPEEERMRKFREALGLPPSDMSSPTSTAPFPVSPKTATAGQRGKLERERIERKLAEKKRELAQRFPPPIPVAQKSEEDDSVSKYFQMERFNQPEIVPEKISSSVEVNRPIIESDFFKILEKQELVAVSPATRLSEIFGGSSDLRRLILAQEILGRPKSLQTA